jgi:hypothetical protein
VISVHFLHKQQQENRRIDHGRSRRDGFNQQAPHLHQDHRQQLCTATLENPYQPGVDTGQKTTSLLFNLQEHSAGRRTNNLLKNMMTCTIKVQHHQLEEETIFPPNSSSVSSLCIMTLMGVIPKESTLSSPIIIVLRNLLRTYPNPLAPAIVMAFIHMHQQAPPEGMAGQSDNTRNSGMPSSAEPWL